MVALGAKVIAAAGSQEKLDVSIKLGGADHGVNYSKEGWQKEVLKLTGGKGVDVIYDPVGLIRGTRRFRFRPLRTRISWLWLSRLAEVYRVEGPRDRGRLRGGTD